MSPHTRQAIKSYLEGFIAGVIDAFVTQDLDPRELRPPRTVSVHGDLKPFHEAVLPHGILSITAFERSCSSRLGTTFEESARLMGAETFHYLAPVEVSSITMLCARRRSVRHRCTGPSGLDTSRHRGKAGRRLRSQQE